MCIDRNLKKSKTPAMNAFDTIGHALKPQQDHTLTAAIHQGLCLQLRALQNHFRKLHK